MSTSIRELTTQFRQSFLLLVKIKHIIPIEDELTEFELIESLDIADAVVNQRLVGDPLEWQKDHKRQYRSLFDSIKKEVIDATNHYFKPSKPSLSIALAKFNTIVLDCLFDALQQAGPERAPKLASMMIRSVKRDFENMIPIHVDDATVARRLLTQMYRKRNMAKKSPMNKKQRKNVIKQTVDRLMAA